MAIYSGGLRGEVDWPVRQGDDWVMRYRLSVAGVPIADFTGYTFIGEVRAFPSEGAPRIAVISFGLSEGDGYVTQSVARADTTVEANEYVWEAKWIPPSGKLRTLMGGKLMVAPQTPVYVP